MSSLITAISFDYLDVTPTCDVTDLALIYLIR